MRKCAFFVLKFYTANCIVSTIRRKQISPTKPSKSACISWKSTHLFWRKCFFFFGCCLKFEVLLFWCQRTHCWIWFMKGVAYFFHTIKRKVYIDEQTCRTINSYSRKTKYQLFLHTPWFINTDDLLNIEVKCVFSTSSPLFVTWHIGRDRRLRGCIGTFNSMNLHSGKIFIPSMESWQYFKPWKVMYLS